MAPSPTDPTPDPIKLPVRQSPVCLPVRHPTPESTYVMDRHGLAFCMCNSPAQAATIVASLNAAERMREAIWHAAVAIDNNVAECAMKSGQSDQWLGKVRDSLRAALAQPEEPAHE